MSGCIFKTVYDCDYCETKKLIEKAYNRGKQVERIVDKGWTKVFIFPKSMTTRPTHPTHKYKGMECTCKE